MTLLNRLKRYSPKCLTDALDSDFAGAVWEAVGLLEDIENGKLEPVVHCHDCIQWEPGYIDERDNFVPPRCFAFDEPVHFNDYCSWGVKIDG